MISNPPISPRFFALIPCGGAGTRAGQYAPSASAPLPKQYQRIAGKPLVAHTLAAFAQVPRIGQTVTLIAADDAWFATLLGATHLVAACAGSMRSETVFNGLNWLKNQGADAQDWVLVHDAARCLITPAQINALIDACQNDAVGGLLALPLSDTLKTSVVGNDGQRVTSTLNRADKWLAQTPQMFRIGALMDALDKARQAGVAVTDESSAIESQGLQPRLVEGSMHNFKVTYPADFALAEAILKARL